MGKVSAINEIVNDVTQTINQSQDKLFQIIDNLRKAYDKKIMKLEDLKKNLTQVIKENDKLEILDRKMRSHLAHASSSFETGKEKHLQEIYEQALKVHTTFKLKRQEETMLRKERDELEIELRQSLKDIEDAEQMGQQLSTALRFLGGDLNELLKEAKDESNLVNGVYVLQAQEAERIRIGRELHDGPAQHMANVVMMVDFCKTVVKKDLDTGLKELEGLKVNLRTALQEVRRILFDLKPVALETLPLVEAIEELIEHTLIETNIKIKRSINPIHEDVHPMVQITIYRLIQEALNNIRKHSKATEAVIQLECGETNIFIMIKDDGEGFDVEQTLQVGELGRQAYGLTGMMERVDQLKGKLTIRSEPNRGTTYYIKIPIQ